VLSTNPQLQLQVTQDNSIICVPARNIIANMGIHKVPVVATNYQMLINCMVYSWEMHKYS